MAGQVLLTTWNECGGTWIAFSVRLPGRHTGRTHAGVFPLVNVTEDQDHFYIRSEIPGMKSEEISISATGRNLSISGERKIASEGENVKYHRREREDGKFSRVIALPSDIQIDKIEAGYVDGILSIKIPKAEEAKPKQITVK